MIDREKAEEKNINIIDLNKSIENDNSEIIEKLKAILPNVINSDNVLNIEALKDIIDISNTTANNQGYELTFAGKGLAKANVNMPITKEIKTELSQSKNFENTDNVVIRGDNLEVLKLLKQNYYGKIKMIYIDPPYNTESDKFIYNDNFKSTTDELIEKFDLKEDTINYIQNVYDTKTHSGWLSMMYPRLKLARELLSDDGVIFISIDDNEQACLKLLCDEIFGNDLVDMMIWRKSGISRDGKMKNTSTFRKDHEYINICFKKELYLNKSYEKPEWANTYKNNDNDYRGTYKAGSISKKEDASNPNHHRYYTVVSPSKKTFTRQFDISKEEFDKLDKDNRIYWGVNGDSVPSQKIFVDEKRIVTTSSAIIENDDYLKDTFINANEATTTKGSDELNIILDTTGIGELLRPKPIFLLYKLIQIGTNNNDIVLDFFAGSGTTGDAVMQLNAEDGGKRKFILVQWDEKIKNEEKYKSAYDFCVNNNLEPVISSITIERLNRAGEKIITAKPELQGTLDIGYKVFSLTEKREVTQTNLLLHTETHNISSIDKLYNMMIATSIPLDTKIVAVEADALYKIGNAYYIIKNITTMPADFKDFKIYIDAYSDIDLENYLNISSINKENISVIY